MKELSGVDYKDLTDEGKTLLLSTIYDKRIDINSTDANEWIDLAIDLKVSSSHSPNWTTMWIGSRTSPTIEVSQHFHPGTSVGIIDFRDLLIKLCVMYAQMKIRLSR